MAAVLFVSLFTGNHINEFGFEVFQEAPKENEQLKHVGYMVVLPHTFPNLYLSICGGFVLSKKIPNNY